MEKFLVLLFSFILCLSLNSQTIKSQKPQSNQQKTQSNQRKPQSNQQKAESLINNFMKNNLNDYKSYEPLEYSKIEDLQSNFFMTEISSLYMNVGQLSLSYYEKSEDDIYLEQYESARERAFSLAKEVLADCGKYKDNFPQIHIGYLVTHKCRSKDSKGNLKLGTWNFGFDRTLTKIIYISSDFPEGKQYLSNDYLLEIKEFKEPINTIIKSMSKYISELEKIKKSEN